MRWLKRLFPPISQRPLMYFSGYNLADISGKTIAQSDNLWELIRIAKEQYPEEGILITFFTSLNDIDTFVPLVRTSDGWLIPSSHDSSIVPTGQRV